MFLFFTVRGSISNSQHLELKAIKSAEVLYHKEQSRGFFVAVSVSAVLLLFSSDLQKDGDSIRPDAKMEKMEKMYNTVQIHINELSFK